MTNEKETGERLDLIKSIYENVLDNKDTIRGCIPVRYEATSKIGKIHLERELLIEFCK